jgi:anti-sigma B factor antagonist
VTDAPRPFAIADAPVGPAPGIAVRGEIDVANVMDLEVALEAAVRGSEGAFVLDLSDVDFIDSTGLRVLLWARSLLGREDRSLALVCRPGPVTRALEVSGIADLFFTYGSPEAAAAALVPAD